MKQLSLSRLVAAACILCASGGAAMAAQTAKHGNDPARWYNADSTQQQRMGVLKKEINAAYAEQSAACKHQASSKRSACMKQARATYEHDNAHARQLVANAPQSEITERVVSVSAAPDTGMQAAGSAYGSSAGGSTGAGSGMGQSQSPRSQSQSVQGLSGTQQSGMSGSATTQSSYGANSLQQGAQSATQSATPMNGQAGMQSNGGAYGNSAGGTSAAGQGDSAINGAQQSGSQNGNGSQSQSMGAGTGATQSDTQGQSGATPPVQR